MTKIKTLDFEAEFEKSQNVFAETDINPINDEIEGILDKLELLEKNFR